MDLLPEPSRSDPGDDERHGKHRPAGERSNGVNYEEKSEKEADHSVNTDSGSFTHTARFAPEIL